MENTQKILGKNLRDLIEFRGLKNKTELAKLLGINHKTIYDIYSDIGNPKLETLDSIGHPSFFGLHFIFKKMPSFKLINLNKGIILMVKKTRLLNLFLLNLSFVRI